MLFIPLLQFVCALGNGDYLILQSAIKTFINQEPIRRIPLLVRASFHDLAGYDSSNGYGPHGCLYRSDIQQIPQNAGLSEIILDLASYITTAIPNVKYPLGDVISLAGKTSIEIVHPCIQIDWSFGRSDCKAEGSPGQLPDGTFSSMTQMQPFLNRYGLSATEMGLLIAGGHAIPNAIANPVNSGFGINDAKQPRQYLPKPLQDPAFSTLIGIWITDNINLQWRETQTPRGSIQFKSKYDFPPRPLRLPVDLLFFPSTVKRSGGSIRPDFTAKQVEDYLQSFKSNDTVLESAFAEVYSKMLKIGTGNEQLVGFIEPPPSCGTVNLLNVLPTSDVYITVKANTPTIDSVYVTGDFSNWLTCPTNSIGPIQCTNIKQDIWDCGKVTLPTGSAFRWNAFSFGNTSSTQCSIPHWSNSTDKVFIAKPDLNLHTIL
ncbi:hypothetical protein HK103_006174 [Boothiomyces macroporosus]|uniref:Peroxidase n=1 Tax=Boothiomyces macroporosus TaxID=261099 RepID=A0AAD5Y7B6_9FUNG|nr:hypothetical protein HK103_006174 [Boothiomyces macroporosus]